MKSASRSHVQALECRRLMADATATINFGETHQTMEGMGASLINWVGPERMPQLQQASFYDKLVNDLGASAIRGAIHPNFELTNDNNDPNTFNWAGFNNQPMANVFTYFKRMHERGVRTFLLSVWTPPYWQKTNMAAAGGGFIRPDQRAEFAEYVAAAVITAKRDYGVDISAVSVQNEQFFHEWYESSIMDNVMMREATIAVQKKLAAENLPTKVLANEDLGFVDPHRWKWFNEPLLADPQIDRSKLVIGSHYTMVNVMNQQAAQLEGSGVPLWYTESSGKTASWADGVLTAAEMSEALTRANAAAYFYWQFDNLGDTAWNANSALLNDGQPTGKYEAVKHLYKYIRPGMQRVTTSTAAADTYLGAYRDPQTGASTITLINNAAEANTYTLNVSNFAPGTVFRIWRSTETEKWVQLPAMTVGATMSITLPAQSLVTLYSGAELPTQSGLGTYASPDWQVKDALTNSNLRFGAYIGDIPSVTSALANESINSAHPASGWTALHAAAASPFGGADNVINYLISQGANVNVVDAKGWTPLHAVAANAWQQWNSNGSMLIQRVNNKIASLIAAGADINARDAMGRTPLHWAAAIPLMYTEWGYNTAILNTLLAAGADPTLLDNDGKSAYDLGTADYRETFEDFLATANPVNTTPPVARFVAYNVDTNQIDLSTTEDTTASFEAADVTIIDLATNLAVTQWTFNDTFNYGITIGKIAFSTRLPDGRYRMTIAAGAISDQLNLPSATAIVLNFEVLRGDATGDGNVNFDDLLVVAQNYGKSNRRWRTGDFNGDNVVNFDDLLIVAQQYGSTLPVPAVTKPFAVRAKAKDRLII
jgi:O-glycosyl hydrolase